MRKLLRRLRRDQRGQGLTEYIIIVALIAIAAIGVVTLFGDNIRDIFAGASDALAGEQRVRVNSERARAEHTASKNLRDFASQLQGSTR
jgi:Flp pilus assembly pilin Flp